MGENILLVDPAASFAQFVSLVLTRLGHRGVAHVPSGGMALTLLDGWTPQLVLSETRLPDMRGLDFCAALRQRCASPFVFLTTDSAPSTREAALAAGANEYLTKPVNSRTLHDAAERYLPFDSRRRHLRTVMSLEAEVTEGGRDHRLRTLSVGEGGLFLETAQPSSVGTALRIRLPLPGLGGPLDLAAEVVHASAGEGAGPRGMGVKFVGLDENTRIFLKHYLETYVGGGDPVAALRG